jgi:hypothetical protein
MATASALLAGVTPWFFLRLARTCIAVKMHKPVAVKRQ